jgi:DNA-binding beta-propeller fold protein YncE
MVFNPNTGHFLLTNGNASGDITYGTVDEIDPFHTFPGGPPLGVPAVINSFVVPSCMPSGIAMGPGTDALVTCAGHDGRQFAPTTYIINGTTGAIVSTINFVGGVDQGWFNPGDGKYYLAARDMLPGPVLGVIDARTRQWLQNVPTNGNAHSVAADPINNHIFVPLPAGGNCLSQAIDGCVGVYASE